MPPMADFNRSRNQTMTHSSPQFHAGRWSTAVFLLLNVSIMLLAIGNDSFWIDEFWNAYFASLDSLGSLYQALREPYGSQTPLHFVYGYFWAQASPASEFALRLSNLPLFVLGQVSLLWALRDYPKPMAYAMLIISALHPMVWQYSNEFRPYIMMYAGAEMLLAYMLHIHAAVEKNRSPSDLGLLIFVVGGILLFGASLLGVFWVASACAYMLHFRHRSAPQGNPSARFRLGLVCVFIAINGLLAVYYINSLLHGAGGSRLSGPSLSSMIFALYELLGLSGIGPGRLDLRDAGAASLRSYMLGLIPVSVVLLTTLAAGVREAKNALGIRSLVLVLVLGISPVAIVVAAGFSMHWRFLGRHLIATLPLLNLLFAMGLAKFWSTGSHRFFVRKVAVPIIFLIALTASSLNLRFADRHLKEDYQSASTIAKQELAAGKRVWWVADVLGARYYGLPGEFDYMGELTNKPKPYECLDRTGVQSVGDAPAECLGKLAAPDIVLLSRPETFDRNGVIAAYLKAGSFVKVQDLPAFTVWRPPTPADASPMRLRR